MRRSVTCIVLFSFCLQTTSGAAMPMKSSTISPAPSLLASMDDHTRLAMSALSSGIMGTHLAALVSGQESRWEAMHAPPPTFMRRVLPHPTPNPYPARYRGTPAYGSVAPFPRGLFFTRRGMVVTDPWLRRTPQAIGGLRNSAALPNAKGVRSPYITYTYQVSATPSSLNGSAPGSGAVTLTCSQSLNGIDFFTVACTGITATSGNSAVATASIGTIGSSTTPSTVTYVAAGATSITYAWNGVSASVQVNLSQGQGGSPAPTLSPSPVPEPTPNTGVNPYWTYEYYGIPGVGSAMVNAGNGNLIEQETDADIPERGIDLVYRRTYNEFPTVSSINGYTGTGWTSTYEAHISYNASNGNMRVFDVDGAVYKYTPSGSNWAPPPGQYATLRFDGCSYIWQKKLGSLYKFAPPDVTSVSQSCGYTSVNQDNRLMEIIARDTLNYITFTYSFSGSNVSQVIAAHSDGQSMTLTFNTNGQLTTLLRPDGQTITYTYDPNTGNLSCVNELTNNTGYATHCYTWNSSNQLAGVNSPRYQHVSTDGGYTTFTYTTSNHVASITRTGLANWNICDGSGSGGPGSCSYLQPNAPTWMNLSQDTFTYTASQTELTDLDGHATLWTFDSSNRPTQTQEWNGSIWLTSNETWDSNSNLTSAIDVRGNETDYGYDSNGNTLVVELPSVNTSVGTIRPMSVYSYDANNNLTSYCDAVYSNGHFTPWTPGTTPPVCPTAVGTSGSPGPTVYTWATNAQQSGYSANEPYGRLTDSYTPMGYHVTYSYNPANQNNGDYGLPSDVQAASSITQSDGSARTPHVEFMYDGLGNVTQFASHFISGTAQWSYITYDSTYERPISFKDADGHLSYKCYYPNGQLFYTEGPAQHHADGYSTCQTTAPPVANSITYDDDGNIATTTNHSMATSVAQPAPAVTTKLYDGAGPTRRG